MKAEVEYIIKKRKIVECDDFGDIFKSLKKSDWVTGGRLIEMSPTIISKVIIDKSVNEFTPDEKIYIESSTPKIKTNEEWFEELKRRITYLQKQHILWSKEKCIFVAKQNMPDIPEKEENIE